MAAKYWSVYLDHTLIDRAKKAAKQRGISLNAFIVDSLSHALEIEEDSQFVMKLTGLEDDN